jgi:cytochrome c peroxidase
MKKTTGIILTFISGILVFVACNKKSDTTTGGTATDPYAAIKVAFGININPLSPANYANQGKPVYITRDNNGGAALNNNKATLGRVLFYDKNLSFNNTVSCGSCHKQAFAFSDTAIASNGVAGGTTGRHSMRLINARFATEPKFFWDERAASLEIQTTTPVKDHSEMGFSGQSGRPDINALLAKLAAIDYYQELFQWVYGDKTVTEQRLQECLANFVRSIQSFDSRYDAGRATAPNDGAPFTNFTASENQGKNLFLQPPVFNATGVRTGGGAGCAGCHAPPEFDIEPNSLNNGVIGKIGGGTDLTVTRSPTLRDVVKANGTSNGPFMHIGLSNNLITVINHYNQINLAGNTNLDPKLRPNSNGQQLQLTDPEKTALVDFIRTLAGTNVYSDVKWSNPFK